MQKCFGKVTNAGCYCKFNFLIMCSSLYIFYSQNRNTWLVEYGMKCCDLLGRKPKFSFFVCFVSFLSGSVPVIIDVYSCDAGKA